MTDQSRPERDQESSVAQKDFPTSETDATSDPEPAAESQPASESASAAALASMTEMGQDRQQDPQQPAESENDKPEDYEPEDDAEETAESDGADGADEVEEDIVLAKDPEQPTSPPVVGVKSGPEKRLSGFLDTLDERARTWWSARKERREQLRAQIHEQPAEVSEHPGAEAAAEADAELRLPTGALELPEPPSPKRETRAQPASGSAPAVDPAQSHFTAPAPPAAELPIRDSAADQVPTPTQAAAGSDGPAAKSAESHSPGEAADRPAGAAAGSAEETVVLPAYRDQDQPPRPSAPAEPAAYSAPPTPPRVRRALDEQRRRDLIVQKARAIEDATTTYGGQQPHAGFADDEEDLYTYIPPYNLPSRDPDPTPTRTDLYRRIFVSLGAVASLIATAWMFGWFGADDTPAMLGGNGLAEAYADGWYSGEHALLSPDHNVFWLWPVISVGLMVHAVFQWGITQESTPRQRRSGWLISSASLLTLGATASLHYGLVTLMALASISIALLLLEAIREFNLHTARSTVERRATDGIVGLFFGFALVQAMSAVSVWLTAHGWQLPGIPALLWAGVGLFLCVWTAAYYSMTERGRITIALGLGWGMFWLIFPRLLAEVTSVWVAIGAAMGAFIVILSTQSRRHRINHAERRAAMGRPLEDII